MKHANVTRVAALAVLLGLSGATLTWAEDQPQWGQRFTRNMVSDEKALPDSFDPDTGRNIKWAVPLGTETHSTPVIAGGRVLVGTNNNVPRDSKYQGDRGVLMCLDEKEGKLCWQLVVPKITTSRYWDWANAGLCSPPTVEGDRVYVVSNRGEVMCLDLAGLANGNDGPFRDEARHAAPPSQPPVELGPLDADILWLYDLIKERNVRQHDSAHCSILLYGQYLYVNTSNGVDDSHIHINSPDAPSLVVIDKSNGRLVAQDQEHIGPRIFHSTWSSPALGVVNGRPLVIFCGGDGVVYAFDALPDPPQKSGGTSADTGSAVGASALLTLHKVWQFDPDPTGPKENVHRFNSNRRESPSNIKSMPVFDHNRVYITVGGDLWWGKNQAWLKCIDATQTGDVTRTAEIWSYPLERHCMSTPAVHAGLVYVVDCGRRIHCVDAQTGRPCWTHDTKGEFWASPLVADHKVYAASRRGEFFVFAESREKKLLTQLDLGEPVSSTPVAANGVLYIATMSKLFALKR